MDFYYGIFQYLLLSRFNTVQCVCFLLWYISIPEKTVFESLQFCFYYDSVQGLVAISHKSPKTINNTLFSPVSLPGREAANPIAFVQDAQYINCTFQLVLDEFNIINKPN